MKVPKKNGKVLLVWKIFGQNTKSNLSLKVNVMALPDIKCYEFLFINLSAC